MAELLVYVDPDAVGGGTGVDWTNAYTSLSAMEAAEQDDFDTANDWLHVYCRSSGSTADTTNLEINGSTTSSDDYIKIEGASGHRAKKTSWDASIYRLAPAASNTVNVYDNHVWFDGIQFACPTTGIYTANLTAGSWTFISNCRNNGSATWLAPNDSDGNMYIWNCINTGGGRFLDFNSGTSYVYNSIAYGSSQDGIRFIAGSSGAIYNTVSFKNGDDFDFHGGITVDHCASDDGDGTNDVAESGGGAEWPDDFTDAAAGDFTLDSGSNLVGAGVADPQSGLFSTDIDGDTYASPPSLGVDEIAGGGAYSLVLDAASIAITGSAMSPLVDRTLGFGAGSYVITGVAVGTLIERMLGLDAGEFTLTGTSMTPLTERALGLGSGSYIIVGTAIDPLTERTLGLGAGEFLLTGTAINMLCEKILDLGTGTYILTGSEIDVLRDAILGLEAGAYIIVGKDVITVYSGGGAVLATMFFIHNF